MRVRPWGDAEHSEMAFEILEGRWRDEPRSNRTLRHVARRSPFASVGEAVFRAMPSDLALSTNTPTATFELQQAQPLGDGRFFAAFLLVRSGAFAAARPYVVLRQELLDFAEAVSSLLTTHAGIAHLAASDGDDVVRLEATDAGGLRITGTLHDPDDSAQLLRFGFTAQWEGVPYLADGLHGMIASEIR